MRPWPLLLALLAAPVRAEFCLMEGGFKGRGREPSFYRLRQPKCPSGSQLVFGSRWNLAGYSEEAELLVHDFWPPLWGTRERCRGAAAGAAALESRRPSYVLGSTLGSRIGFTGMMPRVFAWEGSCEDFRQAYRGKLGSGTAEPGAILKDIGAREIDNDAFVELLTKSQPKKKG